MHHCKETKRVRRAPRRIGLGATLAAFTLAASLQTVADDTVKEKQSAFVTADDKAISSTALVKLLNRKLDGKYQDLELVITSCSSGEFATRGAGLKGNWSVSTGSASNRNCVDGQAEGEDIPQKGQDGTEVSGLKVGDDYYHGYAAQYVKKLQEGKNTVGNKALHEFGRDKNYRNTQPQYNSSNAVADAMTVHGGAKSNHAIVVSTPTRHGAAITDGLYEALKGAGYTDGDIKLLRGDGAPAGNVDARATEAEFEKALDEMRVELDKHVGEEKAYVYVEAHGSYALRTVAYLDGRRGEAGGGVLIADHNPGVLVFADDAELVAAWQEELPRAGGGLWSDLPFLQRHGSPYLAFSTLTESFFGTSHAQVFVNGLFAGDVLMGNPLGADYQLSLADTLLDAIMDDMLASGSLRIDFRLPEVTDFFRLAVLEDYLDADVLALDYGVTLGAVLGGAERLVAVAEPLPGALLGLGLLLALGAPGIHWRRLTGRGRRGYP